MLEDLEIHVSTGSDQVRLVMFTTGQSPFQVLSVGVYSLSRDGVHLLNHNRLGNVSRQDS